MLAVLRRYVPLEVARQRSNTPHWPAHEGIIVAAVTLIAVVATFAVAFSATVFLQNNDFAWILLLLLHIPAALRVIVAGAGAFHDERSRTPDQATEIDGLTAFQTLLIKSLAVLRRTWAWSLIYIGPFLVVTAWNNIANKPLMDLSQHLSLTLVLGYSLFFVTTILDLCLSAGLGLLFGAIGRRSRNAALFAAALRFLPLACFVIIVLLEGRCQCAILPTQPDFITKRIVEFSDGGIVTNFLLALPANDFDMVDTLASTRQQSVEEAFLYATILLVVASGALRAIRQNPLLRLPNTG